MLAGMSECEMSERRMSKCQNIPYLFLLPCGGLPVSLSTAVRRFACTRICICAAPGRAAHRTDSGKQTLPDTTF
eukprot:8857449-Karenia_brevis.AAC.1